MFRGLTRIGKLEKGDKGNWDLRGSSDKHEDLFCKFIVMRKGFG